MAKNQEGLSRHANAGLNHDPAYRAKDTDQPKGRDNVRQATYTNSKSRATGVNKQAAYERKAGNL